MFKESSKGKPGFHYMLRRLRMHRGRPSLYVDSPRLADYGFRPGSTYAVEEDAGARKLVLRLGGTSRKVSAKADGVVSVIDINSEAILGRYLEAEPLRVIATVGAIFILPLVSVRQQLDRVDRLLGKLAKGEPLKSVSVSHGLGGTALAAHEGLQAVGVKAELHAAIDLDEGLMLHAMKHHPSWTGRTHAVAAPMQEVVQDKWVLDAMGTVELLDLGLPCAAASKAGVAKNKNARMEQHPRVGHLVVPALMLVRDLQPAAIVVENVVSYRDTSSADLIRAMLRDMGYVVHEAVLNGRDFGSPEPRERWILVAVTSGLDLDLSKVEKTGPGTEPLSGYLEDVPLDSPHWREYAYLKAKESRDLANGKGFKRQEVHPTDTEIPVLRRGYWKGGSTDPMLVHPENPRLLRKLLAAEHCRVKGFDPSLVEGLSEVRAHEGLGQSVVKMVLVKVFECLGRCIKNAQRPSAVTLVDDRYTLITG